MALKPCRECNAIVSENAKTCPSCGIAIKTGWGKFFFWSFLIVISFIWFTAKDKDNSLDSKEVLEKQAIQPSIDDAKTAGIEPTTIYFKLEKKYLI